MFDWEQSQEIDELNKAREVVLRIGAGINPKGDATTQLAILLLLATRVQRLNHNLENLVEATIRRS